MNRFLTGYRGLLWAVIGITSLWLLLTPPVLQAAAAARSIAVTMGDYKFSPDEIRVQAGDSVRLELTNTDGVTPHNFTLQAKAAGLDVNVDVDVGAGKTEIIDLPPLAAGSYSFHCNKKLLFMKSHREHGMEGKLIVEPTGRD